MKRSLGIQRNKLEQFTQFKATKNKPKNRYMNADDKVYLGIEGITFQSKNPQLLSVLLKQIETESKDNLQTQSVTTQNSAGSIETPQKGQALMLYDKAKEQLQYFEQQRSKMAALIKLRISTVKEEDIKKYDTAICGFSKQGVKHILKSEELLKGIRKVRGSNDVQDRFYRNIERSLAQDVRDASRALKSQEKDYFDQLKTYEIGATNEAIRLNTEDREKMTGDLCELEEDHTEQKQRAEQINHLVQSIGLLNEVYKQLNQLVIETGSLIDRIDFNIDETFAHIVRGNEHLQGADKKASNKCANNCIYLLVALILGLAIAIGVKWANIQTTPPGN